jgi:hypothetical protein
VWATLVARVRSLCGCAFACALCVALILPSDEQLVAKIDRSGTLSASSGASWKLPFMIQCAMQPPGEDGGSYSWFWLQTF